MAIDPDRDQIVATTSPSPNTAHVREILARLLTTDTGLDFESQLTLNEALIEVNVAVDLPYPPINNRVIAPHTVAQALDLVEQAQRLLDTEAGDPAAEPGQALAAALACRLLDSVTAPDIDPVGDR